MREGLTIADIIWGVERNPNVDDLIDEINYLSQPDALSLLDAVKHPEAKDVVKILEDQMKSRNFTSSYSTKDHPEHMNAYFKWIASGIDYSNAFLFSDESFHKGFNAVFANLIEKANPIYRRMAGPIDGFVFERID